SSDATDHRFGKTEILFTLYDCHGLESIDRADILPNRSNGYSSGISFRAIGKDKQVALLRELVRTERFHGPPGVLAPVVNEQGNRSKLTTRFQGAHWQERRGIAVHG